MCDEGEEKYICWDYNLHMCRKQTSHSYLLEQKCARTGEYRMLELHDIGFRIFNI